jgi:hypothetical protein
VIKLHNGKTVIGRLQVAANDLGPVVTRVRLTRLLECSRLHPSRLPPAAILCVRRFEDPLPGVLDLRAPGVRVSQRWERAATRALDRLLDGAARPARDHVAARAEAVIFNDRAEMLMCLAQDWCTGTIIQRWWWHVWLRGRDVAAVVLESWLATPEYVPAALHQLGRWAVPFVKRVPPAVAQVMATRVATVFALPGAASIIAARPVRETTPPHGLPAEPVDLSGPSDQAAAGAADTLPDVFPLAEPVAPWDDLVPESRAPGLAIEQRLLLGLALTLARDPARARRESFVQAARTWLVQPDVQKSHDADLIQSGLDTAGLSARPAAPTDMPAAPVSVDLEQFPGTARREHAGTSAPADDSRVDPARHPGKDDALAPETGLHPAVLAVKTAFGGVFYLINLGLYLKLYTDFTTPAQPGIDLSIWDFLALVGEQLVGGALRDDPVWEALAHLAKREPDEDPGVAFDAPGSWRMPPRWLTPFAEMDTWQWTTHADRLIVTHPAGFRIIDVPGDGPPAQQAETELEPYRVQQPITLHRAAEPPEPSAPPGTLAAWLGWLLPYVRARLARALNRALDDPDLGEFVCRHTAHVMITATHVDIFLSLDALPVALRRAGLDRDPGWVPAAGRYIAFHFN